MALSPIGIDIGSYKTVISVVQNGGVDVVLNNYSNRSTPSMMAFTPQGVRLFGEDAKTQSIQNYKTTISQFKHLIKFNSKHEDEYVSAKLVHHDHELGFKLENDIYKPVQLYAMFLGSLKRQVLESGVQIGKCVISVPGNYTPRERELVYIAGTIAGLSDVEVVSEALAAGMTFSAKNHEGSGETKRVIVDVGYSQMTISLLRISNDKVFVEKSIIDDKIGGRVIDKILCDNLLRKVGSNFEIHSKPYQRILKECEKFKKILSANNFVSVNIENVTDDKDINTSVKRDEFEQWIEEKIVFKVGYNIDKFLHKKDQFDSVELIGGTSRIPVIKTLISKGFNTELGLTLNQDEAISLGNAYLSTIFHKKLNENRYKLKDFNLHRIDFFVQKTKFENVLHKNKKNPHSQLFSFDIDGDFSLEAREKHTILSHWKTTGFDPTGPSLVQVEAGLKLDGTLEIISADQVGKSTSSKFTKMFGGKDEYQSVNQLQITKVPLIGKKNLHHYLHKESELHKIDLADQENKETKNLLESTIYKTRRKLTTDELQEQYGPILDQLEDWLYEDGDEAPTEVYRQKLSHLDELPL